MLDARSKLVSALAEQPGKFGRGISCLQGRSHMNQTTQGLPSPTSSSVRMSLTGVGL